MFLSLAFPVRTDAPVYHVPWVTIGLVITNVVMFVVTFILPRQFGVGDEYLFLDGMCITLGESIQPLKWLTYSFYHFNPGHIIFNMLFLWTFGLVVEGKIGWFKYLLVVTTIMAGGGVALQGIFYVLDNSIWLGGASVLTSGLMMMALFWAPRNELGLAYFIWLLFYIRVGIWDVLISSFITVYLVYQVVSCAFGGSFVTSETAHLIGFAIGGVLGYWMLKAKHVDCENWDLFSVRAGKNGRLMKPVLYDEVNTGMGPSAATKERIRKRKAKARKERERRGEKEDVDFVTPAQKATARIQRQLKQRKARAALQVLNEQRQLDPGFQLPGPALLRLAQQLHDLGRADDAVKFLGEYLEQHPDGSDRVRVKLAGLMIQHQQRPSAALRVLEPVDTAELNEADTKQLAALLKKANDMVEDGVIEFGDGAW